MPTLDPRLVSTTVRRVSSVLATHALCWLVVWTAFFVTGCRKDPALDAIQSDANGYVCTNCGAKYYTARKAYMEAKCPKCGQYTLEDVVGYYCEKDKHLTLRPKVSGPAGAAVCEVCGAHLQNAMVTPREKDLVPWGAIKYEPK